MTRMWDSVRPGDMYLVPPGGDDDTYDGRTYIVLSILDRPDGVRAITVLFSEGEKLEWTGRMEDEYYGDVLLSRLKNPGE